MALPRGVLPAHTYLALTAAWSWFSHPSSNQLQASLLQGPCRGQRRCHPKDGLCFSREHMAHAQPWGPISAQGGISCLLPHSPVCPPQSEHQSIYGNSSKVSNPSWLFIQPQLLECILTASHRGSPPSQGSRDQSSFEELGRSPARRFLGGVPWGLECALKVKQLDYLIPSFSSH